MSYCQQVGKDKIIFVTKEDHQEPSTIVLKEEDDEEEEPGLILPNGEINWNCPCLGGMATGPCGMEFRDAFSCFHYSKDEPKGNDCFEKFKSMQGCMMKYPKLYSPSRDDDSDDKPLENNEQNEIEPEETIAKNPT